MCSNVIKKRLNNLNIQARMVAVLRVFERELHPYRQFSLFPYARYSWLQSYPVLPLPAKWKGEQDLQQWKKWAINWVKYPVLLVGKLRRNMSLSWSHTTSEGQSWSWILAYKVWAFPTVPAGPDAIMLTVEDKEMNKGKGQYWLYPSDNPSPSRISHWASEFYQFVLQMMCHSFPLSINSTVTLLPILFQVWRDWEIKQIASSFNTVGNFCSA